jgi:hypothetical protein
MKVVHFDVSGIAETWKCPAEFDIQRLILNRPLTSTRHEHEHDQLGSHRASFRRFENS